MSDYHYEGEELDLFHHATNWKRYWAASVSPFVSGRILDAGAGQGNNLPILLSPRCTEWTALEPDAQLLAKTERLGDIAKDARLKLVAGDTASLLEKQPTPVFDTILYIDVMEHIADDLGEFQRAARLLSPGGHLIVLSPAFQSLYSPFDAAIGHCRRYDRASLQRLKSNELAMEKFFFLDAAGFLLSSANRWMLRQSMPTLSQIQFWDRWVIPLSRWVDPLVGRSVGRSIVGVWKKA
ncbi:MAG: class I SAM-dependent methyltransferase [Roseimicrobium sp.]